MPHKDREERRRYHREYQKRRLRENPEARARHRSLVRKNDQKRIAAIDTEIDKFRKDGCKLCPEKESCCLSAHHIDPTTKEFDVGNFRRLKKSIKVVSAELKKCICLCFNCHAKVHAGVIEPGVEQ